MTLKEKLASLIGPLTLLEWGGILLYFYFSHRVNALLHPSFRPQILVAGALLTACGLLLLLTRQQKAVCGCLGEENCGPETRSSLAGSVFFPLVLLVPFGVATLSSHDVYGANAINMRGTVDSAAGLPGLADKFAKVAPKTAPKAAPAPAPAVAAVEPALPSANSSADPNSAPAATAADPNAGGNDAAADYFKPDANGNIQANVADLLYAADEPTLRAPFAGKSAELIGQFMPATRNNASGNRFKLVRMFMVCCAADAQPVSLLVELPPGGTLPKGVGEMAWTKVIGEVTFPLEEGKVTAVLRAKKVQLSDPPEETMLY